MKAKEYRKIIQKSPDKNTPCYDCSNEEISWCMQNGLKIKPMTKKMYADLCERFNDYTYKQRGKNAKKSNFKKIER